MSYSILNIGATGSGKTYFVKNDVIPKAKNLIVFDLYGDEYADIKEMYIINTVSQYKGGKARLVHDKKIYETKTDLVNSLLIDLTRLKDCTFVFEDATIFLDSKRNNIVKDLLISKRHNNMSYVWLFHTLSEIPPYIFKGSNGVILHRTADLQTAILNKFKGNSKIINAYLNIDKSNDLRKSIFINLNTLK